MSIQLQFRAAQWVSEQQTVAILAGLLPEKAGVHFLLVRNISERAASLILIKIAHVLLMLTPLWRIRAFARTFGRGNGTGSEHKSSQRYTADDAEEMIGKLTGMPIPLNSLRQWILGLPGDATDYKLDDQYRLSEITYSQNGKNWKVVYGGYDTKTQPAMPANMELTDGGQRIKLKMDNWIVK